MKNRHPVFGWVRRNTQCNQRDLRDAVNQLSLVAGLTLTISGADYVLGFGSILMNGWVEFKWRMGTWGDMSWALHNEGMV